MKTILGVTSRSLIFLSLVSACSTSDDDIWYPPTDPGGKADAVSTIRGSDIPSAFVDASKPYLLSRRIDRLNDVGALDAVEARLALRIDGIIANMPSDGRLHLAELVRMEDPSIHDSLFPDELAALPRLWKKVEAPSTNDLVVGPDIAFGVVDTGTPPGPAVPPPSLDIASLVAELGTAASRLQNLFNSDHNATTVTLADLGNAVANPGAFTTAEIVAFGKLQALFREQAVAQADATLAVSPPPGPFARDATLGPVTLHMAGTTSYEEDREAFSSTLQLRLTGKQIHTTTATLPADSKVIVIEKATSIETVFGVGDVPDLQGGAHVFEVWRAGQRVFATNATLPDETRTATVDLADKLDYTLVAGLTPLVRNLVTTTVGSSTLVTHHTFDKTVIAPAGMVNDFVLTRTATPKVSIPVGRYAFPQGNVTLLVFPNNVLWVVKNGQTARLLPIGNSSTNPTRFSNSGLGVSFDASSSMLSGNSPSFSAIVTASMRDI